jgi:hypothetical protein
VNSSLTTVTILVSLLHVAALGVMIWIRVRRSEADGPTTRETGKVTRALCAAGRPPAGGTTGSTRMSSGTRTQAGPGPPT